MLPRKPKKLKREWSFLPQKIVKKKEKKQVEFEMKPWRCRFCKSDAVCFPTVPGVKAHIVQRHKLVVKRNFSDLDEPSATQGKSESSSDESEESSED